MFVTVRSPCLSGVRILRFLREVVPKREVDHVKHHVTCLGSNEDYTSRRDLESSEIQHVISKTFRDKGN